MKRLFGFFMLILLVVIHGCTAPLNNVSTADVNETEISKTNHPATPEPVEESGKQDQQVSNPSPSVLIIQPNPLVVNSPKKPANNHTHDLSAEKKTDPTMDEALDFCEVSQEFWQKGDFENAVEALDKAYSLILNITADNQPRLIQQKEDLRFLISKRILEIYASRNIVINGNHKAIPMDMNKYVQAEINLFTKNSEKSFFIESYKRSGRYREKIVHELQQAGLPVELSWLPLIESGFKANALSKARALGLWQFIPSTGYKFGLKRNIHIDERLDPEKSTKAAILYLKALHQIFGDWTTVLAAYNCGEGRVLRIIRSQNVNYLDNFWDLYERLPRETARYVPRFLATLHIMKNPKKYGLDSIEIEPPLEYETVQVLKQVHLRNVAKTIGVPEKFLKSLNPELRHGILPGNKYNLKIPPGKSKTLLAKINSLPVSSPPRRAYIRHRVKSGETLSTIARKYRTSLRKIVQANNIYKQNFIKAGKTLKIPMRGTTVFRSSKSANSGISSASTHVVKSGDSLWIIARRYNTTTKKIQDTNNLRSTKLSIGQRLNIPGRTKEQPLSTGRKTYLVNSGDSPFLIAKQHNIPLERFLRINNLTPRSKIYPGQTFTIE